MPSRRRWFRAPGEWLVLAFLLAAGAALTAQKQWLWRLDLALYDAASSLVRPAPAADLVIVAIDEASLAMIGRWPWSRRTHAALIDRLTRDGAKAVGLDVILHEPDQLDADADRALAAALRRNGRTVLPVLMEHDHAGVPIESRPLPVFAAAAASLGHIHLELDRDGIVRSAFLREGLQGPRHPHFALALLAVAGYVSTDSPGVRSAAASSGEWVRDQWVHFPFSGAPGAFARVSYADALGERVPEGFFRDRIVLIGATAAGLGDVYPTPVSGQGIPMPGVEVSANLLAAIRSGNTRVPASHAARVWLAPLPVLLLMAAYGALNARRSLLATLAALALFAAGVLVALYWQRIWFPPAAAAVAMLCAYPLWSWRRLESAQRYLDSELVRLQDEPGLLAPARESAAIADPLERRIEAVREATAQLRDMRRFLAQSLDELPQAALVEDANGRIVLANRCAEEYLGSAPSEPLVGAWLETRLARLAPPEAPDGADHWEAVDISGRQLLVSRAPLRTAAGARAGAIVILVDVSALKTAQRKRDELLSYVSHDLRSPLASILALLEVQRDTDSAVDMRARIEAFARRTLALADDLVELSRAEAREAAQFGEVDLAQVAHDAVDEIWPQAQARRIRVDRELDAEALVRGDAHLLRRALTNLLSNAVKYSPEETRIRIGIDRADSDWRVAIADEGYGIAPEDLPHVLEGHRRFRRPGQPFAEGTGLGLALVRTVAEKHGGRVRVARTSERGSCFELRIPASTQPAEEQR
jgi:CHASE2 domain-containing sensor protein/signal transduction histidine kinase